MQKLIYIFILTTLLTAELYSQCSREGAACLNSPTSYEKQVFDVKHIAVDFDFRNIETMQINGVCKTELVWQDSDNRNRYIFNLISLAVDSIKDSKGNSVSFTRDSKDSSLYYIYQKDLQVDAGLSSTFSIAYSGKMTAEPGKNSWGGVFNQDSDVYSIGVCFHCDYVSTMRHWVPIYDYPSDKFTADFNYTVNNGKVVVSNGLLKDVIYNKAANTAEYRWSSKDEAASYLLNFAYGKFVELDYSRPDLPIKVYSLARDTNNTKYNFQKLPKIVAALESQFGKYPFEKVGYVNTQNGAMEHQTLISYPVASNNQNRQSNYMDNDVAAHELAHQWFGDLVSPYDFRDAWLNESFATFAEALWFEKEYNNAKYQNWQRFKASGYMNSTFKSEGALPLYDFSRAAPSSNYPATIYQKGAVVLGMLRYLAGKDNYDNAIRAYLTKYAHTNATIDSFISTFNQETNQDWTWFFDQWVRGKGFPRYLVELGRNANNKATLRFKESQDKSKYGTYKNVPVPVSFNYSFERKDRVFLVSDTSYFETDLDVGFSNISVNLGDSVISLCQFEKVTDLSDETLYDNKLVQFYPNPVKDKLFIKWESNSIGKITIFSNFGTELMTQTFQNAEEIDLKEIPAGVYFAKIEADGLELREKIIKIN